MIPASTAIGSNLLELAEMADSVTEVISPSIPTVATPQTTELGELKAKVASLRRQLSNLQAKGQHRSNWRTWSQSCSPSQSAEVCWYQRHFEDSARKSTLTCTKQVKQLGAMSVAGHTQSRLFYITDRASGINFLIEMGAEVSVVPRSHTHRKTQKGPSLQAINNTSIPK